MKASTRIILIYLAFCSATLALAATVPLSGPADGLLRGALFMAASTLLLHRLMAAETIRRDAAEQALRVQATHDPLTGLVNRAYFQETLQRASARATRSGHHFGVAYIDLDDFKQINDNYGHHVGDLLLQEVARRIGAVVRASDCAARFGGDEFVVLVDDRKECSAYRLADRLREVFSAPFEVANLSLPVTASIGAAFSSEPGHKGADLVQAADRAMYSAKFGRRGKPVAALSSAA